MTLKSGGDGRLIDGLTVDRTTTLETKRKEAGFDSLNEIEQQIQIEISGTASSVPTQQEVDVAFDILFVNATEQRYSNLTVPQVSWGLVLDTPDLIIATVAVVSWNIEDTEAISGARVAVGAYWPGEALFEGTIHMTFQGYGFPSDETAELDLA
jgi:hypothetical protein